MTRNTWTAALALGAVLAVGGAAGADDRDTVPTAGGLSTTMTLGGKGTARQAATEDNELAGGYRGHYYGGYRGWGYGYGGYRGYYGGGYYTSFRGHHGSWGGYYRPAVYYAPRVYYPSYYYSYPVYSTYYYDCAPAVGFTLGIGGATAPTVPLTGLAPAVPQPMAAPAAPNGGTFRYDGGPANPVPQPQADPQAVPPANPNDLPVSLKPRAASPYKYKAYGEK
jgi:hypothetical protein